MELSYDGCVKMTDLLDHFDESLIEDAKDFLLSSDLELMALTLSNNPDKSDNYQMVVSIQLKNEIRTLNYNIGRLKKSMDWSSWIMVIMTFFILILTAVLVWKDIF